MQTDPSHQTQFSEATGAPPAWSIVIPCFNEAQRLPETLEAITGFLDREALDAEILVVDDGSTDGTANLVRRGFPSIRVLENGSNRGKGYSIRSGLLEARGRWVLFSDADLSTPIEEMRKFGEELAGGADLVIGSRALRQSVIEVHQRWWREMSGRIFNRLVHVISGLPYHDTQCGFKAYTQAAAQRIASLQRLDGWAFDVEHLHLARLLKMQVHEVPVHWVNSPASKVRFLRDASKMFADLIRVRLTSYPL